MVILTGVLALIGFLQLLVFGDQARQLRKTVKASSEQSEAMERHITEAAKSVVAMANIATALQNNAIQQLRAYLAVIIGTAVYQDRENGKVFEGRPLLVNNGFSPARNVRHWGKAAILPFPQPDDFVLPPAEEMFIGRGIIGAHQNAQMLITLSDPVPDGEVGEIKYGKGRALYIWGVVQYEDISNATHTTKFCQALTWWSDGKVYGYYIAGKNDAD